MQFSDLILFKSAKEPEKVPLDVLMAQGVPPPQPHMQEKVVEKGIVIKTKYSSVDFL